MILKSRMSELLKIDIYSDIDTRIFLVVSTRSTRGRHLPYPGLARQD